MDEQILKDLIATAQGENYNWDVVMPKFPELASYDVQLLKDYVATAEADNYDYAVVNAKFPEFNFGGEQAEVVKKKGTTESLSEGGGLGESDIDRETIPPVSIDPLSAGDDVTSQLYPINTYTPRNTEDPLYTPNRFSKDLGMYPTESQIEEATQKDLADARYTASLRGELSMPLSGSEMTPRDMRSEDYVHPFDDPTFFLEIEAGDMEGYSRRGAQRNIDRQHTEELIKKEKPEADAKAELERLESERIENEEQLERVNVLESDSFISDLSLIDNSLINKTESQAARDLNKRFGKYKFVFRTIGVGNALEVTAHDGTKHEVDLRPIGGGEDLYQAEMLKEFIKNNLSTPKSKNINDNELDLALRVYNMRSASRINSDGTESTVLLESGEVDGRHVVYPTLFPKTEDYNSNPSTWMELSGLNAYDKALERGEVISFETKEEADAFAEGSWKDISHVDAEANKFFNERGMDYSSYKAQHNIFKESREQIDWLEKAPSFYSALNEYERKKYGEYYVSGELVKDKVDKELNSLQEDYDMRFDLVYDNNYRTVAEDFSVYIDKILQQKSKSAAEANYFAKSAFEALDEYSMSKFGVGVKGLMSLEPKNESEAFVMNQMITEYKDAKNLSELAANRYELSKTFLDSKFDKELRGKLVDNASAFNNALVSGWNRGQAMEELLSMAVGLDGGDEKSTAEVAAAFVDYMNKANTGETNRVQQRFHSDRGFREVWETLKNDPFELALGLAAESMSQMMPYGLKIIPASIAAGAGTGAAIGVTGAGVGAVPGAITGAGYGARTGWAATSLAMEYSNAVMDAMKNQGFDISDPNSVAKALSTQSVWDEGREIGLTRGIAIGAIDYLSGGLAGRVFKTGSVASKPAKVAAFAAERVVFDPAMEALGETVAMIAAGQELDGKEIFAEALGAFGNNTAMGVINMAMDAKNNNDVNIAYNLMDIDNMANESSSDSRITSWANNMEKLGKITSEQNQRIQENVGLRREVNELAGYNVTSKSPKLASRMMQLIAAREELSSTRNRKEVYSESIKEINKELSELVSSKTLKPKEEQNQLVQLLLEVGDMREGVQEYTLNGKKVSKTKFVAHVDKLTSRRAERVKAEVRNDPKISEYLEKKMKEISPKEQTSEGSMSINEDITNENKKETADNYVAELNDTKEADPDTYWSVSAVTPEDAQNGTVIDVDGGKGLVTQDGDIIGVFKKIGSKVKGVADKIIQKSIEAGGFKLDNFDGYLTKIYERNGFRVTSRVPFNEEYAPEGWSEEKNGRPDVVSMVYDPNNELDIEVKTFDNPEEANAYRDSLLEKDLSEEQKEALDLETKDLEDSLEEAFSESSDPQFQLTSSNKNDSKKKKLVEKAIELMEEIMPELEENAEQVEETSKDTIPINVTENTELANKVPKMKLSEIFGKMVNYVMADQLKVSKNLMGGHFFPLMDDMFGRIAWASIDMNSARSIVRGSIGGDYSVVFNMATTAVDSNRAVFNQVISDVEANDKDGAIFSQLVDYIQTVKWGGKTDLVHSIAKEAKSLTEFADMMQEQTGVDTRASIIKKILPSKNVTPSSPIKKSLADIGVTQESVRSEITEQFASELPMGAVTMVLEITDEEGNKITSEADIDKAIVTREQQEAEGMRPHENYPVYVRGRVVAMLSDTLPVWDLDARARELIDIKLTGLMPLKDTYSVTINGDKKIVKVQQNPNGTRTVELFNTKQDKVPSETKTIPKSVKTKTLSVIKKMYGKSATLESEGGRYSSAQAESNAYRAKQMGASSITEVDNPTLTNYEKFINRLSKAFPSVEVMTDQAAFDALFDNAFARQLVTKNQKVYGAVLDGKLYLNPALKNYNTPIHEFGHIWMNVAKEANPELYNKGLELIEDSEYLEAVLADKAYQKVARQMKAEGATQEEIDAYMREEALATAIGDKGDSFVSAAAKRNFKNWVNNLFDFIKKLTGASKMSSEQIQNLSLDEFLQGVVVDLMSEENLLQDAEVTNLSNGLQLMTSPSNASISDIVLLGRSQGFSDASIREVLKKRGFNAKDIKLALEVRIDLFTPMPTEFSKVKSGINDAIKLFNDIRSQLDAFSRPTTVDGNTTQPSMSEVRQKAMDLMKAHPVFKEQTSSVKMSLLSGFDKTLNTRANKNVTAEISRIRQSLRDRSIGVNELKSIQRELKNFIRKNLPVSGSYSQAQINKLVSSVSNMNMDNMEAQQERVLSVIEQQRAKIKKSSIKKIKSLVKAKAKTRRTSSGRRRSSGVTAKGQVFFSAMKNVLKATLSSEPDAMNNIVEILAANEELLDSLWSKPSDEVVSKKDEALMMLQYAHMVLGGIESKSLEEVQDILNDLKNESSESLKKYKEKKAFEASKRESIRKDFTEQISETNKSLFDEDGNVLDANERASRRDEIRLLFKQMKYPQAISKWLGDFGFTTVANTIRSAKNQFSHLGTLTNLVDRIGKGKTLFTEKVYNRLNRMEEAYLVGKFDTERKLDDIAKAAGFENGYKGVLRSLSTGFEELEVRRSDTGRYRTDIFSSNQLLRIYALSLNKEQRNKLKEQGINDSVLSEIESLLDPKLIKFANEAVNFLSNEYFEGVNNVYSNSNEVNLGYVENYFPTMTVQTKVDSKLLQNGDFNGVFNAETSPALKERTDMSSDINLKQGDFTTVLDSHLDSMERYKAYAEGTKEINDIFNIPAVDALLDELGIKGVMKKLINNTVNPYAAMSGTEQNKLIDKLQSKFTGFALAFKAIQILKQSTSFVNAYSEYNFFPKESRVPNLVKSSIDPVMFMLDGAMVILSFAKDVMGKNGSLSEAMEMSASFRSRVKEGMKGDVVGLESGTTTFKPRAKSHTRIGRAASGFKTAAASPTIIGDVLGVMGYMINYKRNIRNGMSKEEAVEVFNNYNATQQTRRGTEKNLLQSNKNFLVRAFTMFGSVIFLQMNKVMSSSTNIMRAATSGKMPSKKDIRDFYLNAAAANVLFAVASNIAMLTKGNSDDRDEALKRIAEAMAGMNLLYQLPFMGEELYKADLIGKAIAESKNKKYKKPFSRNFGGSATNPISSVFYKIGKSTDKNGAVLGTVQGLIEITIGAQADPFIGLVNLFSSDSDEEFEEAIYDAMGISPFYRPKNKKETVNKPKSMSKSELKKSMPKLYKEIYSDSDEILKEIRDIRSEALKGTEMNNLNLE